jgi:16S rRNA G966 N2-methylase RsmD
MVTQAAASAFADPPYAAASAFADPPYAAASAFADPPYAAASVTAHAGAVLVESGPTSGEKSTQAVAESTPRVTAMTKERGTSTRG